MAKIYLFSGVGADERVFHQLDFGSHSVSYVKWVKPLHESMSEYASRLIPQIKDPDPVLIGLSFGGMIAVEVAKQIKTKKVILIASAKTRQELPAYLRMLYFLKLHMVAPASLLKHQNFIVNWFLGVKSESDRKLLKEILKDTDPAFLKWAINEIVCWKNSTYAGDITHIHGTVDRVLPIRYVKCDEKVSGGGHFMTVNKPKTLSRIINQHII